MIIKKACELGVEDCILTAKNYFREWMNNNDKLKNLIPKKFRSIVYCAAIKHGGKLEWEFALEQYKTEINLNSKENLRFGLSCANELWQVNAYLNMQLNEKHTQSKDCIGGLRYGMFSSSWLTWSFVKENWDKLFDR
jgi:aminopeptidase N